MLMYGLMPTSLTERRAFLLVSIFSEIARGAKGLIRMQGNQTFLDPPDITDNSGRATERKTMAFSFDKSYWSAGPRDEPQYCSQQTLYDDLGKELLEHGFAGFNACILTCMSSPLAYDVADSDFVVSCRWANR